MRKVNLLLLIVGLNLLSAYPGHAQSNFTTVCHFTVGPRAGTTFDFARFGAPPIPVGSPCTDGQFSSGVAVSAPTIPAPVPGFQASSNVTTVCQFNSGPRAGTTFDFAPFGVHPIPVGSPCTDGAMSNGIAITRPASADGTHSPVNASTLPPGWRDGRNCDPGGQHCTYFVNFDKLPKVTAQQTIVWCWAAAAQTIFSFYGHAVPQATIVQKAYGTVQIATGQPAAMLRMLNTSYTDAAGTTFNVSTPRYFDKLRMIDGTALMNFSNIQPTLRNQSIFDNLGSNHPVFYADAQHAMAMVGAEAVNTDPQRAWVLDPAPLQPTSNMGPIVAPGVPAVGLRTLSRQEMMGFFAAEVVIE
ncbi:MAG TPA: hypothetical protein VKR55_11495 [Bradyrhizobium sp.]|uniref:hypothetical protein n=1 Tax=Bradyrhizobium sp. TaxID=376 RepID=UPI002B565191|nr:hypothetical protein [Bradyrhizobium sp.]HLZ02761.1 hypothetical protein [Bradyrhizobium sp.]